MTQPATQSSNPAAHEQLCNNCGKCCYKKIIVGRTVFITPFPCEFLNTETNLCTIYDRRHELNPECLSIEQGMKVSAFPEDCPYVPEMAPKGYRPAKDNWDWKHEWDGFDDLADDLEVSPEMREKVRARGPDARPMYVEAFEKIQKEREARMLWGDKNVIDLRHDNATAQNVPSLAKMAAQNSDATDEVREKSVTKVMDELNGRGAP